MRLPPEVESRLNERLAVWASARRLGSADLEAMRAVVLARVSDPASADLATPASADLATRSTPTELDPWTLSTAPAPAQSSAELDATAEFDADWLWSLLRPATALMERSAGVGQSHLSERVERWLKPLTGDRAYQPYLRLA
jgi:hypothetical protein